MKKIYLVLILIFLSILIGQNWDRVGDGDDFFTKKRKTVLMRVALVSDSHNENELLAAALSQAQGAGINFVIGLGDFTSVGTIDELIAAKRVFDESGLVYYLTPGDHDLWDSRNQGVDAATNFRQIFGDPNDVINENGILFLLVNNSDIYTGIDDISWSLLKTSRTTDNKLKLVFSHKTPFHPQSSHVMGEDNEEVAAEANQYINFLENNNFDGFFSGDLHFFAQFHSPNESVKITTVGAVNESRNFQGPRFAILTVFDDYTWEVEDVEIR